MIRLNDLTIGYGRRILLQHASATIPAGELVALVGRNGTGKSTLLRAIAGLGERLGGEIRLDGHSLETLSPQQLATTVSFVTTERVRIPNLRCEDVVALGRAPYTNWIGRVQEQDKAIVERSLELVGMAAFAGKTMDRMSDGECQRVMIARALAQDTPIILLDEPTSGLDPLMQERFLDLVAEERARGAAVLLSSHIFEEVGRACDRVAFIRAGRVAMTCTMDEVRLMRGRGYSVEFSSAAERSRWELAHGAEPAEGDACGVELGDVRDVNALIRELSSYDVASVTSREQTLEELFLHLYEGVELSRQS